MPGRTRYEVARKLRTEEIGRERRLRGTFVVEGIRAVGGRSGAVSVSVRYFALEGNQVRARGTPRAAGPVASAIPRGPQKHVRQQNQGRVVKLADMHDVVTFVRPCHTA